MKDLYKGAEIDDGNIAAVCEPGLDSKDPKPKEVRGGSCLVVLYSTDKHLFVYMRRAEYKDIRFKVTL